MKARVLSAFLTCGCLSLVAGRRDESSSLKNYVSRITNGDDLQPDNFLYLVQLRLLEDDTICGGSVIHEYYILTAAHCIAAETCDSIEISPAIYAGGNMAGIRALECLPYATYQPGNFRHDIGLVRAEENLVHDWHLTLIPLPQPGSVFPPGTAGIILGWGETETGQMSDSLRLGVVEVEDFDECSSEYNEADRCVGGGMCPVLEMPEEDMCTSGGGMEASGACIGDFGGPFIVDGILAGIMSGAIMTNDYCKAYAPSLHVKVASYLTWIDYVIHAEE